MLVAERVAFSLLWLNLTRDSLMQEKFILSHGLRVQSILAEKAWLEEELVAVAIGVCGFWLTSGQIMNQLVFSFLPFLQTGTPAHEMVLPPFRVIFLG